MNKTKLKKIIKEELQTVLKEFRSTTLMDLEYVIEALSYRWKKADDCGLIEHVRLVSREAKEDAGWENLGKGEELMRISRLSAQAADKMEEANKVLTRATQRREDLLALESQLDEEESQLVSKHGSDISPWSVAQDLEINQETSDNALTANEIEDFISQRLIKLAGPVEQWTDKHLETFEQINNLLNVLFPSGK